MRSTLQFGHASFDILQFESLGTVLQHQIGGAEGAGAGAADVSWRTGICRSRAAFRIATRRRGNRVAESDELAWMRR